MATNAQWGEFEWGEAEWGSIEAGADWTANGSLLLSASAVLTDFPTWIASGALTLSGIGAITTVTLMVAAGLLVITGSGSLRVARFVGRLEDCGDPISTACQDGWMPGA